MRWSCCMIRFTSGCVFLLSPAVASSLSLVSLSLCCLLSRLLSLQSLLFPHFSHYSLCEPKLEADSDSPAIIATLYYITLLYSTHYMLSSLQAERRNRNVMVLLVYPADVASCKSEVATIFTLRKSALA